MPFFYFINLTRKLRGDTNVFEEPILQELAKTKGKTVAQISSFVVFRL